MINSELEGLIKSLGVTNDNLDKISESISFTLGKGSDNIKSVAQLKETISDVLVDEFKNLSFKDLPKIKVIAAIEENLRKSGSIKEGESVESGIANYVAQQMVDQTTNQKFQQDQNKIDNKKKDQIFGAFNKNQLETNDRLDDIADGVGETNVQLKKQAKEQVVGNGLFGKLAGAGIVAKLLGVTKKIGLVGSGVALFVDAVEGLNNPNLKDNSRGAAAVSSALTGGDNASTLDNAAKFGVMGLAVAGPVGGLIGAGIGAALANVDTKWLADGLDKVFGKIFGKLFDKDFWIGSNGIVKKILGIPRKIQDMAMKLVQPILDFFPNLLEGNKKLGNAIINIIKRPFKLDSWIGPDGLISSFNSVLFGLLKDLSAPVTNLAKGIGGMLMKPFNKDFWFGENGVAKTAFELFLTRFGVPPESLDNVRTAMLSTLSKPLKREFWVGEDGILTKLSDNMNKLVDDVIGEAKMVIQNIKDWLMKPFKDFGNWLFSEENDINNPNSVGNVASEILTKESSSKLLTIDEMRRQNFRRMNRPSVVKENNVDSNTALEMELKAIEREKQNNQNTIANVATSNSVNSGNVANVQIKGNSEVNDSSIGFINSRGWGN